MGPDGTRMGSQVNRDDAGAGEFSGIHAATSPGAHSGTISAVSSAASVERGESGRGIGEDLPWERGTRAEHGSRGPAPGRRA